MNGTVLVILISYIIIISLANMHKTIAFVNNVVELMITLTLPAMIDTVLKFPHSKFHFNWMNISLCVSKFLP